MELDPKVQVAAGGARRGRVPQVPIQRSQLGVDRGRAVALPAAALLHGHRIGGQVQVPVTGDYLATLDAYGTHRETRLKGIV